MSKIRIFSLGGLNENGKNMYVVDVDNDLFVFDAGIKFPEDNLLGIDYIIPNFDYLKNNINRIKGIFLTHGHEENMGAIPDIIKEIPNINVYGTKFTLEILKGDLEDEKVKNANLIEIMAHKKIDFGVNSVFPIQVTHSIPDSVAYVLYTSDGAIFYTGDFVFDSTMIGAYKTDIGKIAYVGKQGVLCLLSESVYAEREEYTSPKHRTSKILREILFKNEHRIIFSVLSSQIYRMQELFDEVTKTDRKIVIMGSKLQRIIDGAINSGYIKLNKNKIGNLSNVNDDNIVILVATNKERVFSHIERIANGYDKYVQIKDTDTVVIAESLQNVEKHEANVCNQLAKIGANVTTLPSKKHLMHHASKEDLMLMLNLTNPKYYMPVKGEYRYQFANANVASEIGISKDNIILKQNGDVVQFENGKLVEHFEHIETNDILIDGKFSEDIGELVLKDRALLSNDGIVIVVCTIDKRSKMILAGPEILTRGFVYVKESKEILDEAKSISLEVIDKNKSNNFVDFVKIKNGIREKLGKYLYKETECRPMIITVIQEI